MSATESDTTGRSGTESDAFRELTIGTVSSRIAREPYLESALIPTERYTSQEWLALEYERLWSYVWQMACREEEIPNMGDYFEYTIGDQSVLLVRQADGTINGYHNSCLHRGTRLKQGEGTSSELRCRYHGWCWHLDGRISEVPDAQDFAAECVTRDRLSLPKVAVDTWGGFVFINFDQDCEPLLEFLDPIPEWLAPYEVEKLRLWRCRTTIMQANWKAGLDAFNEVYHLTATHLLDLGGVYRTDALGRGRDEAVAELPSNAGNWIYTPLKYHNLLFPDDSVSNLTLKELGPDPRTAVLEGLKVLLEISMVHQTEIDHILSLDEIPSDMRIQDFYAKVRRDTFHAQGINLSRLNDHQLTGHVDFNFFPNVIGPISGGNGIQFRFRPNGSDPDTCVLDVMFYHRFPDGQEPELQKEYYPNWRDHDDWGDALLQDLCNMPHVQAGMHQRGHRGLILGRQEVLLRNHHRVMERFLGVE